MLHRGKQKGLSLGGNGEAAGIEEDKATTGPYIEESGFVDDVGIVIVLVGEQFVTLSEKEAVFVQRIQAEQSSVGSNPDKTALVFRKTVCRLAFFGLNPLKAAPGDIHLVETGIFCSDPQSA